MLNIEGYYIEPELRVDRQDTHNGIGGGLMVYVKEGLSVKPKKHNSPFNQMCTFELKAENGQDDINFVLYYRSPNSKQENTDYLEEIINSCPKNTLIIGDLNMPEINWASNLCPKRYESFLNTTTEKNFTQLIGFPTHVRGNILDCAFTNTPEKVIDIQPLGFLGNSDHTVISFDLIFGAEFIESSEQIPDWRNADTAGLKSYFDEIKWSEKLQDLDVEDSWATLKGTIQAGIDTFVPFKDRRKRTSPPWLNKHVKKLTRKKQKLWDKYKLRLSTESFEKYKACEKDCKKAVSRAKKKLEKKLSQSSNPRPFNSYIKSKTKGKSGIGPLKSGPTTYSDLPNMTRILNDYFTSVFTREDITTIPKPDPLPVHTPISDLVCNRTDVLKAIDDLKPHSAPGPDKIGSKLIIDHKESLANGLTIIFNRSLLTGVVPNDWTTAHVTPIFKKGQKCEASNYRPISLTSIPCKILERVIKSHIVSHLDHNLLINTSQHGFLANKSTVTDLLEFFEYVTASYD